MNYRKLTTVLLASSTLAAFSMNAEGILGQRTIGVAGSYIDAGNDLDGYGVGVEYAHPLIAAQQDSFAADVRITYQYDRLKDSPWRQTSHSAFAEFVGYGWATKPLRPFFTLGAGYSWDKAQLGGLEMKDDGALLTAGVGAEWEVAPAFTLTPSLTFGYQVDSPYSKSWTSGIEAAYWINSGVNLAVFYNYTNVESGGDQNIYGAAVRFRF